MYLGLGAANINVSNVSSHLIVTNDSGASGNNECKIFTFGNKLIFANTGNTRSKPWGDRDPSTEWDNLQTVESSLRSVEANHSETNHTQALAELVGVGADDSQSRVPSHR